MRLVRDRPVVRLFPSRRRFALSKLIAYARLRVRRSGTGPERHREDERRHTVLAIDRDQSAVEAYFVGGLHFAVCTCFLASCMPLRLPWSLLCAAVLEPWIVLIPCFLTGGLIMPLWSSLRKRSTVHFEPANAMVLMTLAMAASVAMIMQGGWVLPVGALFLGMATLNAGASVTLRLLSASIDGWEKRCAA